MSKSVSNDALWEKLSEISEQLNSRKQTVNMPDFSGAKEEIIAKIEEKTQLLGMHGDSNYGAINQNIATANEKIGKVWNIVARIWKQQREATERQAESDTGQRLDVLEMQAKVNQEYLDFRFFKLRKTSVVITVLGLLVLILTLFCMKQQNDYTLLSQEYYRQCIIIKKMQEDTDN